MHDWPLGVFASIDAGLGVRLEVARDLGVPTIQLHAPHKASRTPERARAFLAQLEALGIRITVVFGGFEGESYADIPTVAQTVGLVPPATRAARTREMKEIADFARLLGVDAVGLHLGFVPHDPADPLYREVLAVTRDLCDHCRRQQQRVHLETGQESADALLRFLTDAECDNLFVNFDPANMIMYGSGDPIEALSKVGSFVRSVHCKDARWAARPGEEWGSEVPLGEGDVGMERFLRTLAAVGYDGPLTIEREISQEPERQKAEIGQGLRLLEELKAKIGPQQMQGPAKE
ncbi:MAG: sugar phosphate isomerase/epimerase family protein [Thermoguttaceae bacterium]|jgi:sugar phosphate isomerase/epimerase